MDSVIRVKEGVEFSVIAPGGFRILSALDQTAFNLGVKLVITDSDITITSGTDGCHSGEHDPHLRGEAFDVRSQTYTQDVKKQILDSVMNILGYTHFYGFLEAEGTDNEHFHFQVKKNTIYPS